MEELLGMVEVVLGIPDVAEIVTGFHELLPEFLADYGRRILYPECKRCHVNRGCMACGKWDKYMMFYRLNDDEVFTCCPNRGQCWAQFLTAPPSCSHCDKWGRCDCL